MDIAAIVNNLTNIFYVVNNEHVILYASPSASALTGKDSCDITGRLCYSEFMGRDKVCPTCPVLRPDGKREIIIHDVIDYRGSRCFYEATFTELPDGLYVENLNNVTAIYDENQRLIHEYKKFRAGKVSQQLNKSELSGKLDSILNVNDHLNFGILVADRSYNIRYANKKLKNNFKENAPEYCYNIYGYTEPCAACPYAGPDIKKTTQTIGTKHVTVNFEMLEGMLVETVRDSTNELRLIGEIQQFQNEVQEKQRQMILLNEDLLRMNEKIKAAQNVINEELEQVGMIQQSLLPEKLPEIAGYEFGAFYIPAEHAGGDYYDCIEMSNGFYGLTIADVSGHGTPAAVVMAITRAIMHSYTYDVISSAEALAMVNEILCKNVHTGDFVTMFYAVLNSKNNSLNYASAGHNPVLHFVKSEMMVKQITASGMFMASFPDIDYEEKQLELAEGDILFMYTDGLVEAMNASREQYGINRVITKLIMYHNVSADILIDEIMTDVKDFTENAPFEDDVTILVIKR